MNFTRIRNEINLKRGLQLPEILPHGCLACENLSFSICVKAACVLLLQDAFSGPLKLLPLLCPWTCSSPSDSLSHGRRCIPFRVYTKVCLAHAACQLSPLGVKMPHSPSLLSALPGTASSPLVDLLSPSTHHVLSTVITTFT